MEEQKDSDSVLKYLNVLVSTYPDGINQAELAAKADVTEAAVSLQRKKLYQFTVKDKFAFHELVLSMETSVLGRIAWIFLSNKMFSRFIMSKYGRAVINQLDVHSKLCEGFPPYAKFFKRDDTNLMVAAVMSQLTALDKIDKIRIQPSELQAKIGQLSTQVGLVAVEVLSHLTLNIRSERQLNAWIGIRDKWYFMIESLLFEVIPQLDIVSEVSDKEKFIEVYRRTSSHYLKKGFVPFNAFLRDCAAKSDVRFDARYEPIGSVFHPIDWK